jgi:hypothetical protein
MISAIFDAILMVLGLILDIITLPFRLVAALLGGAGFEFQRFSRRRSPDQVSRRPSAPRLPLALGLPI